MWALLRLAGIAGIAGLVLAVMVSLAPAPPGGATGPAPSIPGSFGPAASTGRSSSPADRRRTARHPHRTAGLVDEEVTRIVGEQAARATRLLTEGRDALDAVATALLEHETLDAGDVERLVRGGRTVRTG